MEILLILILLAIGLFWLDSVGKRETAVNIGRELTSRCQLQLLDETVACYRLSLKRNRLGRVQIQRWYTFEATASGAERLQCQLVLLGNQLQEWQVPPHPASIH